MYVVFYAHRPDSTGGIQTVETGKVVLTPYGPMTEGEGSYWMNVYPQGLIAGDDDASYLRALAGCVSRLTYCSAKVVEA
jgi:hypothetical protein